jgi:hypothetical protein
MRQFTLGALQYDNPNGQGEPIANRYTVAGAASYSEALRMAAAWVLENHERWGWNLYHTVYSAKEQFSVSNSE